MPALQLPKNARGGRLCRHPTPGACTWWCTYRLVTLACGLPAVALGAIIVPILLNAGPEAGERLRDSGYALGAWLAVVLPMITGMNRRDRSGSHRSNR